MWEDWESVNRYLGDTSETIHGSEKKYRDYRTLDIPDLIRVTKTLSESGRKYMCIALEEEYNLYLRVLSLSRNLKDEEILESLNVARKNCPWLDLKLPSRDIGNDDNAAVQLHMSKGRGTWEL